MNLQAQIPSGKGGRDVVCCVVAGLEVVVVRCVVGVVIGRDVVGVVAGRCVVAETANFIIKNINHGNLSVSLSDLR